MSLELTLDPNSMSMVPVRPGPDAETSPLPLPWRDPKSISKAELAAYIAHLKAACTAEPHSVSLRTCLGIAHAVDLDVYACLDALTEARKLDPNDFWAQQKYAELHYRLRALPKAERETEAALRLAGSAFEAAVARKQLNEIRRLIREGIQKPEWTKPLMPAVMACAAVSVVLCVLAVWL